MNFDKDLVAGKLRRWDRYLNRYHLPAWEEIPDIGLYMEQVVTLLRGYLDYLPPELKEEEAVTAAAINNYVRTRAMPGPVKKRYYRLHLAYLIMICTLKQGLGISLVQRLIPSELTEEELCPIYTEYIGRHSLAAVYFTREGRAACDHWWFFPPAGGEAPAAGRPHRRRWRQSGTSPVKPGTIYPIKKPAAAP